MILVTLGTQDKQFPRLLDAVQKAIDDGAIKDRVVVQAGHTVYKSNDMEIFDFIEQEKFSAFLNSADLIITHGGVGTIMTALKEHKKILAAARLVQYGEHQSDHQVELLESFNDDHYLIYMKDLSDIRPYLAQADIFAPEKYVSNQDHMIHMIESWIDTH
ncbi:MAG: exopolysaccharide biosynthesis protein [Erysipelotrichia bacterium]|nr:exopolysaccharide biosynthesis protein [Erysipelotrichia bacterium]